MGKTILITGASSGTDSLRYRVGPDADELLGQREEQDDATFIAGIKEMFHL